MAEVRQQKVTTEENAGVGNWFAWGGRIRDNWLG